MIKIEKIIPGGQALGTDENGKKIFFWNALPGEIVTEYQIAKNKSNFSEAIALEVKNQSKYRVVPKDKCFLSTSPWQIIDFSYELELKSLLVQEIFREHQIAIEKPEIFTDGCDYFYRNKMEYALFWDKNSQEIKIAFHERGSHRKTPVKTSSIERPEIFNRAQEIIRNLNLKHEEAKKYQSLLLRCDKNGKVSGGLYENKKPHPVFENLTDQILGHTYSYSPNGFFQINLPVYEMALSEIKKHISTENVLDLYAGVGSIGLSVASDKNLTLVEIDKSAYNEMVKNINMANGPLLEESPERVRNGNILGLLDKSENATNYITPDQTVILDPPRAGCDQKLIDRLLEVQPEKIIYLSCNPATQARDVKLLLEKYHIEDIKTYNFFPHTPHIENLVVLSK